MSIYESRIGTQMLQWAYSSSNSLERLIDRLSLQPWRSCAAPSVTDTRTNEVPGSRMWEEWYNPRDGLRLVRTDLLLNLGKTEKITDTIAATPWYLPMRHQQWGVLCTYLICWSLSWNFSFDSLSSNLKAGTLFYSSLASYLMSK